MIHATNSRGLTFVFQLDGEPRSGALDNPRIPYQKDKVVLKVRGLY